MVALLVLIMLALGLVLAFFLFRSLPSRPELEDQALLEIRDEVDIAFKTSRNSNLITMLTVLYLPLALVSSITPLVFSLPNNLPTRVFPRVWKSVSYIAHKTTPRSAVMLDELDQTATLLAGATSLGFSLYAIAEDYYQEWASRQNALVSQPEIEMPRICRLARQE